MKNVTKQICVIGLGQFGSELALSAARNCEVLAIDKDQERVDSIADEVDRALIADAKDLTVIRSLVSPDIDAAVVSLGESVEASILCTLHLHKIGVKRIYAKAVSEEHAEVLTAVGATDIIFPERETARRVAARIANPNFVDFIPLADGYDVMEIVAPDSFHGQSLAELDVRKRYGVLIVAIVRQQPKAFVFVPEPHFVIHSGDRLVVVGKENDVRSISED